MKEITIKITITNNGKFINAARAVNLLRAGMVREALKDNDNNISWACKSIGMCRTTFTRIMKDELGIIPMVRAWRN